jgi:hypothetical protein
MGIAKKVLLEQELELRQERTIATIKVAASGGPVRQLITGREPHPTGRPVCIKAGFRALPWESMRGELPFMQLAEVASPISRLMAQPHQLDMNVTGLQSVLTFFPDFQLSADARFIKDLLSGTPFWVAALRWEPNSPSFEARTLIVEVKLDSDPRVKDPEYLHKLGLARDLYEMLGWSFVTVVKSLDLPVNDVERGVNKIWLKNLTMVTTADVARISDFISGEGGASTYGDATEHLAPGPLGRAKLAALHVRRVVRIDLSKGLTDYSLVTLINDGGAMI